MEDLVGTQGNQALRLDVNPLIKGFLDGEHCGVPAGKAS